SRAAARPPSEVGTGTRIGTRTTCGGGSGDAGAGAPRRSGRRLYHAAALSDAAAEATANHRKARDLALRAGAGTKTSGIGTVTTVPHAAHLSRRPASASRTRTLLPHRHATEIAIDLARPPPPGKNRSPRPGHHTPAGARNSARGAAC